MQRVCKCHGMSGSCSVRVCWRKLPPFRTIGDALLTRFEGASHVKLVEKKKKKIKKLRAVSKDLKPPNKTDLVYLQESPDYCEMNETLVTICLIEKFTGETEILTDCVFSDWECLAPEEGSAIGRASASTGAAFSAAEGATRQECERSRKSVSAILFGVAKSSVKCVSTKKKNISATKLSVFHVVFCHNVNSNISTLYLLNIGKCFAAKQNEKKTFSI